MNKLLITIVFMMVSVSVHAAIEFRGARVAASPPGTFSSTVSLRNTGNSTAYAYLHWWAMPSGVTPQWVPKSASIVIPPYANRMVTIALGQGVPLCFSNVVGTDLYDFILHVYSQNSPQLVVGKPPCIITDSGDRVLED